MSVILLLISICNIHTHRGAVNRVDINKKAEAEDENASALRHQAGEEYRRQRLDRIGYVLVWQIRVVDNLKQSHGDHPVGFQTLGLLA